ALEYPDGALARLTHKNGLLAQVLFPDDRAVRIGRDINGFIVSVEEGQVFQETTRKLGWYTSATIGGRKVTRTSYIDELGPEQWEKYRHWLMERDLSGRMVTFISSCGNQLKIEHARHQEEGLNQYVTVVHDL